MGGLIPDSFIEELLRRVDIVELIGQRVTLKHAGREYKACCPFHEEKTPSFTVSAQKQFYHCFGCGAHGTAIGFLMKHEGLEFVDAVEELARQAGLVVPRDASARPQPADDLFSVLEDASRYYQEQLRRSAPAKEYLKGRGVSGEIAAEFGIGFAPAGWDGLRNALGTDAQRLGLLKRAGLLSEGKSGPYDKFRQRIMFPIHDRRGRVIAFGGRLIEGEGPKYLNSPETELFHKGRELYGLYLARKSQARLTRMLVVEGYLDVVALAQYGLRNTVATLGTAVGGEQVELVFRAADEALFCFDGDRAGRQAAWRALEATLPRLREGRQARFLFLPEGEDPDSMVRKSGAEGFTALLDQAQPLSEFFFSHFTAMVDMNTIDGRARLVELAMPQIRAMPEGVFRDMMQERLETLARHRLDRPQRRPAARPQGQQPRRAEVQPPGRAALRLALTHLVQNPALAGSIAERERLRDCDFPGMELFQELVDFCLAHPNMTTAQLLELWRGHPAQKHLAQFALQALHGDAEQAAREFKDALRSLELLWIESLLDRLPRLTLQNEQENQRLRQLQERSQQLKRELADEKEEG